MKTYYKKYDIVDIKGFLDCDENDKYFISYEDGDETKIIDLNDFLESVCGNYLQIKKINE